jgi:hypothetical protein
MPWLLAVLEGINQRCVYPPRVFPFSVFPSILLSILLLINKEVDTFIQQAATPMYGTYVWTINQNRSFGQLRP